MASVTLKVVPLLSHPPACHQAGPTLSPAAHSHTAHGRITALPTCLTAVVVSGKVVSLHVPTSLQPQVCGPTPVSRRH